MQFNNVDTAQPSASNLDELEVVLPYLRYAIIAAIALSVLIGTGSLLGLMLPQIAESNFLSGNSNILTVLTDYSIAAVLTCLLILIQRKYVTLALAIACIGGIFAIWWSATFNGKGFFDPVLVFLFVILIVSAAFLGQRGLIIGGVTSFLAIGASFYTANFTDIYLDGPTPSIANLMVYGAALLMATIFLKVTLARLVVRAKQLEMQAKELEISRNELRKHQSRLEELVESRTEELTAAKIRAEDANRSKSLFLTNMSHELRTPLNAIIGYGELIGEQIGEDGEIEAIGGDAERITRAGKHLLGLINMVLDLSKIESDKLEVVASSISLDKLLQEITVLTKPNIERNNNIFLVDSKSSVEIFNSDEARIRQILLNLIGNAAKFTKQGMITLEVDSNDHQIIFKVTDTGIGIEPDFLPKVFDQFSQADSSSTKKHEGTGLGMNITKRLCTLLGGEIVVESNYGIGTTFTVKLPLELEV